MKKKIRNPNADIQITGGIGFVNNRRYTNPNIRINRF